MSKQTTEKVKKSREEKRRELVDLIMLYTNDNSFDITRFRKENKKEYSLIPHYFGSINEAMNELHLVKLVTGTVKEGNKLTLKDNLAYQQIKYLRDKGLTFEEIAKQFGVSKMLVSRMYSVLQDKLESNNKNETIESK